MRDVLRDERTLDCALYFSTVVPDPGLVIFSDQQLLYLGTPSSSDWRAILHIAFFPIS